MKASCTRSSRRSHAGLIASLYLAAGLGWTGLGVWAGAGGIGWQLALVGGGGLGLYALLTRLARERAGERAAHAAEARRYRMLMEASGDCIYLIDEDGRLVEANGAFYRALGHDPAFPPKGLMLPEWDTRWVAGQAGSRPREWPAAGRVYDTLYRDRLGGLCEVEVSAVFVELEGARLWLCVGRDLTERKRRELARGRVDRIEGLALLSGGIAHELNNALAPIVLGAEMLRESHPELGADSRLDTIAGSARRGADVVRRVLTFARGADGERLPVSAVGLVEALASEIEAGGRPDLIVRREIEAQAPGLTGDATQLREVLRSLAINAIEAMAGGGRRGPGVLTLGARGRELTMEEASRHGGLRAGPHVEFFVRDTGPGLSEEARRQLFSPFFTTKPFGSAEGLGLATALGLVRGHGGVIEHRDPPEGGAEFGVLLPVDAGGRRFGVE